MSKTSNRREWMGRAAAGAAAAFCAPGTAAAQDSGPRPMLRRGDRIDLAGGEEQVLQTAYRFGYDYQKRHGGCAQCTVAALQDALPFVPAEVNLFRGAACLDGGATPKGVQNCGSFTGAAMVIGHLCGRTRDEIFFGENGLCHELVRKVYQRFEEQYGSVLCKDVRERAKGDCPEVVGKAARWTAEVLLETFAGYRAEEPPAEKPADAPGPKGTVHPIGQVRESDVKTANP